MDSGFESWDYVRNGQLKLEPRSPGVDSGYQPSPISHHGNEPSPVSDTGSDSVFLFHQHSGLESQNPKSPQQGDVLASYDTSQLPENTKHALQTLLAEYSTEEATPEYIKTPQTEEELDIVALELEEVSQEEKMKLNEMLGNHQIPEIGTEPPSYEESLRNRHGFKPHHQINQCFSSSYQIPHNSSVYQNADSSYEQSYQSDCTPDLVSLLQNNTHRHHMDNNQWSHQLNHDHLHHHNHQQHHHSHLPTETGNIPFSNTSFTTTPCAVSMETSTTEVRVRKRCSLKNMPLEERKARRREQNRLAAQRCRQRKKNSSVDVEEQYHEEYMKNTQLKDEVELARAERDKLQHILNNHLSYCTLHLNNRV